MRPDKSPTAVLASRCASTTLLELKKPRKAPQLVTTMMGAK
jgi:hypothetical protein